MTGNLADGVAQSEGDAEELKADVRNIMDDIRSAVEQKRAAGFYRDVPLPFDLRYFRVGPSGSEVHITLDVLRAASKLNIDGEPIRSHRRVTGFFVKAVKKLTRYWTRKYTDPLFLQQSYFNAQVLTALAALQQEVEVLKRRLEETGQGAPPPGDRTTEPPKVAS